MYNNFITDTKNINEWTESHTISFGVYIYYLFIIYSLCNWTSSVNDMQRYIENLVVGNIILHVVIDYKILSVFSFILFM